MDTSNFAENNILGIRDISEKDATLITEWKNQEIFREMSVGRDHEIRYLDQLNDIMNSISSSGEEYYIIFLKKSDANEINRPIGYIRINWMDSNKEYVWLRFGIGEERGKGYCTMALNLLLKKMFENKIHRVDAEVYSYNEASYKVLSKLGFKKEGIKREAHKDMGKYYDIFVMGLLETDFIV